MCGKPTGGVCAECYIRDNPITIKPETYKECARCNKYVFKGVDYTDHELLMPQVASKSIRPPGGAKIAIKSVTSSRGQGKETIEAEVDLTYNRLTTSQKIKWDLWPEKFTCEACKKIGSGYYEAVIQLRDGELRLNLDEKEIADLEKVRGGLDVHMISLAYTQGKVSELINKGYLVEKSSKLFTKKSGKEIYRNYFSVKHPAYYAGDFIEYDDRTLRVDTMGKMVRVTDIATGKTTSYTSHKLEDAKVIAKSDKVKDAIVTEVRPDGMQLMDSVDCSTYEVKAKPDHTQGQEVKYIKIKDKVYLL